MSTETTDFITADPTVYSQLKFLFYPVTQFYSPVTIMVHVVLPVIKTITTSPNVVKKCEIKQYKTR
jgi:hypothetical protein